MRRALAIVVAHCALGAGCTSSHGAPHQTFSRITVGPEDLTTSTRDHGASPVVVVESGIIAEVFAVNDGLEFTRAISVVAWPSLRPVDGRVVMSSPPANGDYRFHFEFVPTTPFVDEWYALRVDLTDIGASYSTRAPQPDPDLARGVITHRFFPGSRPLVVASLVDAAEYDLTYLTVGGSEPLRSPSGDPIDLVMLSSGGTRSTCHAEGGSNPAQDLLDRRVMTLECSHIDLNGEVTLEISPGFASLTGVPLVGPDGTANIVLRWTPGVDGLQAPNEPTAAFFAVGGGT